MQRPIGKTSLLALLFAGFLAQPAVAETFTWGRAAEETTVLRVEIVRGDIVVRPTAGDRIELRAVKSGRATERRQVRIEVDDKGSEATVRAVYPRRPGRDEPELRVDVDVEIALPAGVRLIAKTVVGDIDALRLSDPVEASSEIGDIHISTAAFAEARTTNGSISASLGRLDWSGSVRFSTTNGDVEIEVPGDADLRVSAVSTNGRFRTDLFPVAENRYGIPGARVQGTLGDGGRRLELATVNGDLRLDRRSD